MNKLNLKLAQQAGFHVRPSFDHIQDGIDWSSSSWGYDNCVENLIKLVVTECIKLSDQALQNNESPTDMIKSHFKVEP